MKRILMALALCGLASGAWAQDFIRYTPGFKGGAVTAPITFPDGAAGSPAITFTSQTTTGFYYTANTINVAVGGTRYFVFNTSGFSITDNAVPIRLGASSDVLLHRDAAAALQFGADAATATAQTIKAADSTGANVTGASLTVRAGAGTNGAATGGQLILGGGASAGAGERGAVAFEDGGTKPTCAAGIRGSVWYDAGGAGVLDTFEVCRKDAANNYAWVTLF